MIKTLFVFACAAALFGCGGKSGGYKPPAASNKGEPKLATELTPQNAFPMAVGNQWVYTVEETAAAANGRTASGKGELVWKIASVKKTATGTQAMVEIIVKKKIVERQAWELNDKGLFQVSMGVTGKNLFEPPLPNLLFPATKDRAFSWKGTSMGDNGKRVNISVKGRIGAPRSVDTAKEPLAAVPVESIMTYPDPNTKATSTSFFAPNVGMVRYVSEMSTPKGRIARRVVLKSFRGVQ
ncbi:MAG: hypothetical protein WAO58_01985 [Fimbriimonadaceae bacterium]